MEQLTASAVRESERAVLLRGGSYSLPSGVAGVSSRMPATTVARGMPLDSPENLWDVFEDLIEQRREGDQGGNNFNLCHARAYRGTKIR
jgi:hypothetical protein